MALYSSASMAGTLNPSLVEAVRLGDRLSRPLSSESLVASVFVSVSVSLSVGECTTASGTPQATLRSLWQSTLLESRHLQAASSLEREVEEKKAGKAGVRLINSVY